MSSSYALFLGILPIRSPSISAFLSALKIDLRELSSVPTCTDRLIISLRPLCSCITLELDEEDIKESKAGQSISCTLFGSNLPKATHIFR